MFERGNPYRNIDEDGHEIVTFVLACAAAGALIGGTMAAYNQYKAGASVSEWNTWKNVLGSAGLGAITAVAIGLAGLGVGGATLAVTGSATAGKVATISTALMGEAFVQMPTVGMDDKLVEEEKEKENKDITKIKDSKDEELLNQNHPSNLEKAWQEFSRRGIMGGGGGIPQSVPYYEKDDGTVVWGPGPRPSPSPNPDPEPTPE